MVVAARILSSQSRQALVAIPHFIQDGNGLKLSKGGQSQTGKTKHSQGAHHMELASARGEKLFTASDIQVGDPLPGNKASRWKMMLVMSDILSSFAELCRQCGKSESHAITSASSLLQRLRWAVTTTTTS